LHILPQKEHLLHKHHYHIHRASEDNIKTGRRPEYGAAPTNRYSTLEEAVFFFISEIHIQNANSLFVDTKQGCLTLEIKTKDD